MCPQAPQGLIFMVATEKDKTFLPLASWPCIPVPQKESRIFKKQASSGDGDAGTWKDGDMTIKYWKGMYMLENNKNKVLYQGMWDNK